ncbi:MAG: hypothetical protein WBF53_15295 [Litorimonas sp.]
MTVIARKIALAAEAPPDRPDAEALARAARPALVAMISDWLGEDEPDIVDCTGRWVPVEDVDLPSIIISRQGASKTLRAALALDAPLAFAAVGRLLRIDVGTDSALTEMLKPYLSETVLSLDAALDGLDCLSGLGAGRVGWTRMEPCDLLPLMGEGDLLELTLTLLDPSGQPARVVLVATSAVLGAPQDAPDHACASTPTKQPPRLGPCQIEVRAVGDRIRMSVADCSRLKIGQVVALPGLRFDQLELTVSMDDGPVPLTDAALGADKGIKAVRLNRGLDPDFRAPPPGGGPGPSGYGTAQV